MLFAILAVFIAGLMVGRTPEYLGKRIEGKEVKMAMLGLIATAAGILLFTGASSTGFTANLNNAGPHGLSEILYAFSSAAAISGTLPTHGLLFVALLIGTIVIVGAHTFFPALSLGPIVEHFLPQQGRLF